MKLCIDMIKNCTIYSKYEYLERIFFDAILGEGNETAPPPNPNQVNMTPLVRIKLKIIKKDRMSIRKSKIEIKIMKD